MIDITIDVKEVIRRLQGLPGALTRASHKTLGDAARTVLNRISQPGRKPSYPINWDSPKQRRYVMAKLRREDNLPYQRTGGTEQAWGMSTIENGHRVENIGHKAVFLYGAPSGNFPSAVHVTKSGQSHIHAGRWPLIRTILDQVLARLPEKLLEDLRIEVNQ